MWVAYIIWVFGRILIPPGAPAEEESTAVNMIRIDIPPG